jgi:hypothetical protein
MKTPLFILFIGVSMVVSARDPFWPIGYTGVQKTEPPEEIPKTPAPEPIRVLTDEELNRLAVEQEAKIKESLDRKATMVSNGKVHAFVNGSWVSVGDSLTIRVLGNTYRLEILTLTTDNIKLEPHRTQTGTSRN